MVDILAENPSGEVAMGPDGTEPRMLYNIAMDVKSDELHDLLVQLNKRISPGRVSFDQDDHGQL